MNLKVFTPEAFLKPKAVQAVRPVFTVSKNSALTINKILAEQLKLNNGDRVILAQDESAPNDWFIAKGNGKGFVVRLNKNESMSFACKPFAELLRQQFSKRKPPIRIPVSPQVTKIESEGYFALLTKAAE